MWTDAGDVPVVDEGTLLIRVGGGDRGAMAELIDRVQGPLWRVCLAWAGDEGAAEDALQETFIAILRHASSFHGASARAWMFQIARNAARRRHRRRAGEPARFEGEEALALRAGWGADPFDLVAAGESERVAARALAALDDDDRAVLTLRDIEGLSGPEVAAALEVPLAVMKSRLHRARLRWMAAARAEVGDVAG
jgi:RNA polymerase sigma-70 factor (ECF subfamily)